MSRKSFNMCSNIRDYLFDIERNLQEDIFIVFTSYDGLSEIVRLVVYHNQSRFDGNRQSCLLFVTSNLITLLQKVTLRAIAPKL